MIDELMPYPKCKASGVLWLDHIPVHWDVVPSKALFRHRKDRAFAEDQMLTASQSHGIISRDRFMAIEGRRVMQVVTGKDILKHVEPNDFVMSMRSFQGGLEWARIGGAISSAYVMLIPQQAVHSPYYAKLLKCQPYIAALRRTSDLVRDGQALRYANFGQIHLPLPPSDEQAAIARYLDHANARIERAIRVKRKLIALLNEQKQAIIHRAITCGLNPAVKLKPSGISWLGNVPKHWEVLRSKYIYREIDSRSASGEETHLSMSQKHGLVPRSQLEQRGLVSDSYKGAKLCEKGDLVLNRLKAHLGVFALATEPGLISPDYTVLRPVREIEPKFFEAAYRTPACRVELRQRAKGIVEGFWRLYTDDFYDIRMPVPPLMEQRRIVKRIDTDLIDVNAAVDRTEREIDLLREYRTTLTAEVVTGKLDVREAAKHLSAEAEEPLPADNLPDDEEVPEEPDA